MHTITVNRFQLPVSAHHGDFLISPKGKSMHKHLIGILLILSTMAMAEEQKTMCANNAGTIIMGAVTNTPYCKSNHTMDWWNAISWCDGQNKRLFHHSDCACDITTDCAIICPELINASTDFAWSSTTKDLSLALRIDLSTGMTYSTSYGPYHAYKRYKHYAICK